MVTPKEVSEKKSNLFHPLRQANYRKAYSPTLYLVLLGLLCSSARAQENYADYEAAKKAVASLQQVLDAKEGTPDERLAKGRTFAATLGGSPWTKVTLEHELVNYQLYKVKDAQGALQSAEAALAKLGEAPIRYPLVSDKIKLLTKDDSQAAVNYAKTQWPSVRTQNRKYLSWVAVPYITALQTNGDVPTSVEVLQDLWTINLSNAGNVQGDWMTTKLNSVFLEAGQNTQALSYAKLGWMLAAFNTESLNGATKALLMAWAVSDVGGKNSDAFLKAQTEANVPNPLREVPLPVLTPEVLSQQLQQAGTSTEARITVLLAGGQFRRAMLVARQGTVDRPNAPDSVAQVCRVFKAADLSLVRANAYLAWIKTPEGPNPMLAFLQEHPAATEETTPQLP